MPSAQSSETNSASPAAADSTDSGNAAPPTGPGGDPPATAGPGETAVKSETPENRQGHLNPSAPEDANVTPGSAGTK